HDGATLANLLMRDSARADCPETLPDPVQTDCPPDDDPPFTSVAGVLGVDPETLRPAQSPDAPPSDNLAGFAHIAHLMDAGVTAPTATATAQGADAFAQSMQSTTGSVQAYLAGVQERLRPGETIRMK